MGADDTPPDAMPARGDHGPTDAAWFREWRRDITSTLRDLATRLSGIESRLSEGTATLDKHGDQIKELAAADAEHHRRIEKLERDGGSGLVARVVALESSSAARTTAEAKAQAVADAAAQSTFRRLMLKAAEGAADKAGTMIALAVLAILLLVARSTFFAQAAGVSVPASAPAGSGAHP